MANNLDDVGKILEDSGGKKRFMGAKNGDHLMVPFQCKLCHFRNIFERELELQNF